MNYREIVTPLKFDLNGLIVAVVQDARTKRVLTVGYMNRESIRKTLESGETWFFSRRRQRLWHKGEISGNTQRVERIHADCDGDALLVEVTPTGPACHTGAESCFFQLLHEPDASLVPSSDEERADLEAALSYLFRVILERREKLPAGSYTTSLFARGLDTICAKVTEEAAETVEAAQMGNRDHLIYETADLLYHLLVLLAERGIALDEISQELRLRFGKKSKAEYHSSR